MRLFQRPVWLACLYFLGSLLLVGAQESVEASTSSPDTSTDDPTNNALRSSQQVYEALTELRAIKPPAYLGGLGSENGVFGSAFYYAKTIFDLLFRNNPLLESEATSQLSKPLTHAVDLLEQASRDGNLDARFLLAEMNFYGNFSYPRNFTRAFQEYKALADETGNSTAQYILGFMYATGIGDVVERDQAKALLYYTFAADQNDTRAQLATAYRHFSTIGTPKNCNTAVKYYQQVADKVIEYARSGPPGGLPLHRNAYRLADEDGGVYGEGASFTSSGIYAHRGGPTSDQYAAVDDVVEYMDILSRDGDVKTTFTLGRKYYEGAKDIQQNFKRSRRYFLEVAGKYWDKDDKVMNEPGQHPAKWAAKSAAYLGRMYLRAEGVKTNYAEAQRWFKLGLALNEPFCQYQMGVLYLNGLGVRKDAFKASEYFKSAAAQDWPAAQAHLGKLFLDQGNLPIAMKYFDLSARHSHVEALYYLAGAEMDGIGRERSCEVASNRYKMVAERAEQLHTPFIEANLAYKNGDIETATLLYMMAAEHGYEAAQANVAWLLEEKTSVLDISKHLPIKIVKTKTKSRFFHNAALALVYWTRSAKQYNVDAMVKMGDFYLNGRGTDLSVEKAVQCYQWAAESPGSAQALWNLGWMHENGIGVAQDFHLAKRLYDQAVDVAREAYLPVTLSLFKLRWRSWWNEITDGKINSIQPEEDKSKRFRTWTEWFANFLAEGDEQNYGEQDTWRDYDLDNGYDYGNDEEFIGGHVHRDEGQNPEGVVDISDIDLLGELTETIVIMTLALALAILLWYRNLRQVDYQQQQQRARREAVRAPAANANGAAVPSSAPAQSPQAGSSQGQTTEPRNENEDNRGVFPPPDDPNFNAWTAGGIGH